MGRWWRGAFLLVGSGLAACQVEVGPPPTAAAPTADATPTGPVWIYTSMYQSVIDAVDPMLRAKYPGLDPQWFQAGSEKVAARLEAELDAGGSPACLLLTSDPFWYAELRDRGLLQPYLAPNVLHVDQHLVDPDGYWVASRISLMVLGAAGEDAPAAFSDLSDPRWRDRIAMPDPLSSGTAFTTIAFLDPPLLDGWRRNGMVASGGNSAVMARLDSGEKDVGVLLLENLLAGGRKGSKVRAIYPTDGAVAIPGPVALTRACPNPAGAKAVYDFLLSPDGQRAIVAGDMYSVLPELPPPAGAQPLDTLAVRAWKAGFVDAVVADKAGIKSRWAAPL